MIREIVIAAARLTAADAFRGLYRLEALRRSPPALIDCGRPPLRADLADLLLAEVAPIRSGPMPARDLHQLRQPPRLCGLAVPLPRGRTAGRAASTLRAPGRDGLLASLGRMVERQGDRTLGATGWAVPPLADILPAAEPGEIELVVCGAHMSGLPLNPELARLGGRFLREAKTAPIYRLYSLAGGPPRRPGMLRASDGTGAAIRVEVWGPPRPAFGDFLRGVPSPLSIGTVTLADGTSPKGFRCEPAGTVGATDVTALGDWRRVYRGGCGRDEARSGTEAHMRHGDAPTLGAAHPKSGSGPRACPSRGGDTLRWPPRCSAPKAGCQRRDSSRADLPGRGHGERRRSPRSRRARPRSSCRTARGPSRKTRSAPPRRSRRSAAS